MEFWQNLALNAPDGIGIIRFYSLSYIIAFLLTFYLVNKRIKEEPYYKSISKKILEDYFFYAVLSVVIGGRLGYVLFYGFEEFLAAPHRIFWPFHNGQFVGISGMSYHGGLIGVMVGFYLYCRKHKFHVLPFMELFVPAIPLGYTFGRLGNFMNGELYGHKTESAIGMYFINPATGQPFDYLRHPSQLYEAFGEGILLFVILWFLRKKIKSAGVMTGLYLIGYGVVRFIIEFYRMPDAHLGHVLWNFSMGQVLCFFMVLVGLLFVFFGRKNGELPLKIKQKKK